MRISEVRNSLTIGFTNWSAEQWKQQQLNLNIKIFESNLNKNDNLYELEINLILVAEIRRIAANDDWQKRIYEPAKHQWLSFVIEYS